MAYNFKTSPRGARASVVRYGGRAYTVANFTDQDLVDKVNRALAVGLPRRIDIALEHAARVFRKTGRKGSKIVMLLAAGKQTKAPGTKKLKKAVEPLRILGAQTYIMTVGREQSSRELSSIVDQSRDIFHVNESTKLPSMGATIAKQIQERVGK